MNFYFLCPIFRYFQHAKQTNMDDSSQLPLSTLLGFPEELYCDQLMPKVENRRRCFVSCKETLKNADTIQPASTCINLQFRSILDGSSFVGSF